MLWLWCTYVSARAQTMDDENTKMTSKEPPRYGSLQTPSPPSGADSHKVYPGRFYVLAVFTLVVLLQSLAWMTFGTIPTESFKHFGLTDDDIALIAGIALLYRSICDKAIIMMHQKLWRVQYSELWFYYNQPHPPLHSTYNARVRALYFLYQTLIYT